MKRGFTLIELLVVIAIIGILAALLFPVLSKAKNKAQGSLCLNNGKQLMLAMFVYMNENNDFFPPNPDDGNIVPGHNWCPGQSGIGGAQEFNSDVLKDPTRSLLTIYLANETSLLRCPADKRMGVYQGREVPAARSFSMSQAIGTICPGFDKGTGHEGVPDLTVNGPWLDSSFHHRRNAPWRTYGKLAQILAPSPSLLWVLVDEDANGLNDAAFAFDMETPTWRDYPGTYHNFGCGFAFADGHSETHRWTDESTRFNPSNFGHIPNGHLRDWQWMAERTSARAQ